MCDRVAFFAPHALLVLLLLWLSNLARAQGFLLVAQPTLTDPNFAQTVVLVAPTADGGAVGLVLNRPLHFSLADMLPDHPQLSRFREPLRQGGPVDPQGLFAVVQGPGPRGMAARVSEALHIVIEKATLEEVMTADPDTVRFYSGYAGWAPGQLQYEVSQGGWWVLPLDEDAARRRDTDGLWREMSERARAQSTRENAPWFEMPTGGKALAAGSPGRATGAPGWPATGPAPVFRARSATPPVAARAACRRRIRSAA